MRRRALSSDSGKSSGVESIQELHTFEVYDFLAKIIILGPSGCGKSCILHRFVKGDWRVLAAQTIGVEFSSKIVKVGQDENRRSLKLQLWDTAGQERFRSLTRGYYRGSAGVLLVYDVTNQASFDQLGEFLADVRALTSPTTSIIVVANKVDLQDDTDPNVIVPTADVLDFCARNGNIPLIYTSARTGHNIDEAFSRITSMILTKVELGIIDLEEVDSGVQYGDVPRWDNTLPRSARSNYPLAGLFGRQQTSTSRSASGCC